MFHTWISCPNRTLSLAHLAMKMDLPDAHNTGRPQEPAKQWSPGPHVQESQRGHRVTGSRLSETGAKGPGNEAGRISGFQPTPVRVQRTVEVTRSTNEKVVTSAPSQPWGLAPDPSGSVSASALPVADGSGCCARRRLSRRADQWLYSRKLSELRLR